MPKRKIEELEAMARKFVGDGKSPNLYFVTVEGVVVTVTRDFNRAHGEWSQLPRDIETGLEDRKWGTICSTSPDTDEPDAKLFVYDDSEQFRKAHKANPEIYGENHFDFSGI